MIDVASAIMASLKDDGASMGKIYELGGPQVMTVHELVLSLSCFLITTLSDFAVIHLIKIKKKVDCHIKSNMRSSAMRRFVPKKKHLCKFTLSTFSAMGTTCHCFYFIFVLLSTSNNF